MVKNILIISSDYTGHGHKSITTALKEQFAKHPDVSVHVVDGFDLAGNLGVRIGKLYGSVTRNAKDLWKLVWDISLRKPSLLCEITEMSIHDSFLKILRSVKPDLILSVHPNFNGSVINILNKYNINIPFVTFIADLVSITPLWSDPRADYIICPTVESKHKCMEYGVSESKLKVIGFPVRSKFHDHIGKNEKDNSYTLERPLECLIMSGGEGSGNMSRVAKILLKNFNCKVTIIAGRNATLKRRLERTLLAKYPGRVEVHGFTENIQDFMRKSDIAITRGSPNVMMEAVLSNTPLLVTGALPGQEEGNPEFIEKNSLGVVCKELSRLKDTLSVLLEDNAKKLNHIKKTQRELRDPDVAKKIVDFILSIEKRNNVDIPEAPKKMRRTFRARNLMLRSRRH
ncbi:MAG: glycosyltransferase [Clostridia bacterium]|nr:glycosyltransferase [Clostridia bacterium]